MNEVRRDEILGIRIWISLIVEERWKMFDEFQVHSLTTTSVIITHLPTEKKSCSHFYK